MCRWVLRKMVFFRDNDWNQSLEVLGTYNRFEDFEANHEFLRPSRLVANGDFNLFREGISPDYKDPVNKAGGRFVFYVTDNVSFDDIWLRVVKFVMTARFDGTDNINGALVKFRVEEGTVRRTIAIWIRDARRVQPIYDALRAYFQEDFYYVTHKYLARKSAN